ncbi:hypothetical protein [Pseudofulvibacter geojedonensis]|uniref:Uncharacterized protein n=1 Tax=Pseudofulvibacter geojedonensis TaxID=1123758 RepID=A0ABW3I553_9FLAO
MRQIVIVVILSLISTLSWGHEPNEAYFVIKNSRNSIEVEAEFPWTIRNALLKYDKSLENATTKEAFEEVLFSYVKEKLVFFDHEKNQLKLLSIKELPRTGHGHGSRFLIAYQEGNYQKVKNELMFDLYDNQQNHHELITSESITKNYSTTKNNPIFELKVKSNKGLIWGIIGATLFVGFIIIIVRKTL